MLYFKSSKIDITPTTPVRLTGMGHDERSIGVDSKLEINAMIFRQQEKNIFLISIDTLFITITIKQFIYKEINEIFSNIPESDIIVMSTHTHFTPSIEDDRFDIGRKDHEYFELMKNKINELLHLLNQTPFIEVEIITQRGKTSNLTLNRRRKARTISNYFKPFITMEPNPRGYKNEKIEILNIYDIQKEKRIGLIWSFPCHATNFYNKKIVSSEFPGRVRDFLRKKEDFDDLSVLYLPGFAGNVRAYPPKRNSVEKFLRKILQLSYPVKFYRFQNIEEYEKWVGSLIHSFEAIMKDSQMETIGDIDLTTDINKKPLEATLGIKANSIKDIVFRKVNFSRNHAIVTISAEVVAEYEEMLKKIFREDFCIFTGYVDETFGYLPTSKQLIEGGYESKGYFKSFLIEGNFNKEIEKNIESCLKEMR